MRDPLRVFIVEDEALLQLQLEMFLEDAGHIVVGSASSSTTAIVEAITATPDFAFVDIHLADGPTGVTLGRQLVDAGIPVVFMTANARRIPEDFSGAIGVIGKPYTEAGVSDALKFLVQAIRNPPPSPPLPPCLTLAPVIARQWRMN